MIVPTDEPGKPKPKEGLFSKVFDSLLNVPLILIDLFSLGEGCASCGCSGCGCFMLPVILLTLSLFAFSGCI